MLRAVIKENTPIMFYYQEPVRKPNSSRLSPSMEIRTIRRSLRLIENGYYGANGAPIVSYKEGQQKIFQKRRGLRHEHNASSLADNKDCNQGDIPTDTTRRTKIKTNLKSVGHFLLNVLFAFEIAHMLFQQKEIREELQSLRQRMDVFAPLADTIPNFALESQGARVLPKLSTDMYLPQKPTGLFYAAVFNWQCSSKRQRNVIQGHSSLRPGQGWCFSGDSGHLSISLSHPISITHVTLGHITRSQSPHGKIKSAPREFSIYGFRTMEEEGTFLGRMAYDQDGTAFQTFKLPKPNSSVFQFVKLQIESNWGNIENTCIYSFRVHGELQA